MICLLEASKDEIQTARSRSMSDQDLLDTYDELLRETRNGNMAKQRDHIMAIINEIGIEQENGLN